MIQLRDLGRGLVAVMCWIAICGLSGHARAAAEQSVAPAQTKIMFLFKESGHEGIQAVENSLTRVFQQHGYTVLDRQIVAQALQRHAEVLQRYEREVAKYFGARLGADIVIMGNSQVRTHEKTYRSLGNKRVAVSQANVGAKAILASSGKVLTADNARARKPFDFSGDIALAQAAEQLGEKLLKGIGGFLQQEVRAYRLFVLNVTRRHATILQERLGTRVTGVQHVEERSFVHHTLELDISVAKSHDVAFTQRLLRGFPRLGVGNFSAEAYEGATFYLRRMGGTITALSDARTHAAAESTIPLRPNRHILRPQTQILHHQCCSS